ncbi:MAG TPA: DegT/DnrJ/EryC1/StrS aminotransferase family protein [Pseudomonadales bacterium]|nr:DegT/DnrJ/EryC1/StrS aminotransferase family protein [Pseudomonadales bacterium]
MKNSSSDNVVSQRAFQPWPSFTQEEVDAVGRVLLSNKVNYWTGDEGRFFEKEFAQFSHSQFAIALANGTVALDLALIALGIGAGDEVIVTPRTFLASVSCIVNVGAVPVFADVDLDSQNISAESIRDVLTPKTRAIICVHLAGWPCEMDAILALANAKGLYVIEDCAQAHGALYKGQSVGSWGHVAAWSFCQDKIITTGGEGGMLTTNDALLWEKAWAYKDHGKSFDAVYNKEHPSGFRWLHESFGTNWRLTEMQSAIGRIQLRRMPEWHQKRKNNALALLSAFQPFIDKGLVRVPLPASHVEHAYYKFYVFVEPLALKASWSRDRILHEFSQCGLPCFQGSCSEVYLEKAFDNTEFRPKQRLPNAKQLGETSLMFVVHPSLDDAAIKVMQDSIFSVFERVR